MAKRRTLSSDKFLRAYMIGVALGDGNLSNPNGRAVRLRISCDKKYPKLLAHIKKSLRLLLPENNVHVIERGICADVAVYSNQLTKLIGYQWDAGPKDDQNVCVPLWIMDNVCYGRECLRGLLQTDGCIYTDRGYRMVSFVNTGHRLAMDVSIIMENLGHAPNIQKIFQENGKIRYTVRISKNTESFIKDIGLWKK